jgi:hypothetical protein
VHEDQREAEQDGEGEQPPHGQSSQRRTHGVILPGRAACGRRDLPELAGLVAVATDGKTYKLSDYKGKQAVVVAWFPKAFTRGRTIECKSLAEHGDMNRAAYFMASVDPVEENAKFGAEHNADFPLLSDPAKEVATKR